MGKCRRLLEGALSSFATRQVDPKTLPLLPATRASFG